MGEVRRQPVRGLAQHRHRPRGSDDHRRRADLRRPVRRHPQVGARGVARLRRPAGLLEHRLRARRLRRARAVVVRPGRAAPTCSSTSARRRTRSAPPRRRRSGRTRGDDQAPAFNRDHPQVDGDIYFSAKDVRANRLGHMDIVQAEHYAHPALLPVTAGVPGHRAAPGHPARRRPLRRRRAADLARRTGTSYAVYRVDGRKVDRCDTRRRHAPGRDRARTSSGSTPPPRAAASRTS